MPSYQNAEITVIAEELGLDVQTHIERLEDKLHLKRAFLSHLIEEDDWAFIVKTHAFLEAAFTHFLAEYFQEDNLTAIFARIELGNKQTGKVAFAKAIGILTEDERHLLTQFSELRNTVVHDIANVYFSLETYAQSLQNTTQRNNFIRAFTYWQTSNNFSKRFETLSQELVIKKPKVSIFLSISALIEHLFDRPKDIERKKTLQGKLKALRDEMDRIIISER
ncbi:hypothetical protein U14_01918 [Candidatus Moduliflexus flocculans]|uniref:Uncharacterized protein n=1 Tax=Candidatus Moduliflexus flocculans TaxID=1499966 RepID=A0A0S6VT49_9BACT|nr:hypothetical protein U14_01918 [Candidatus Moduliflexus flocculans]